MIRDRVLPTSTMSPSGVRYLERISRLLNGRKVILHRPALHHVATRTFYLQSAREATRVITMPALTPTMTDGHINQWKKKEGEAVSVGDVLCEIESDKGHMDVECDIKGVLAKIIKGDGSKGLPIGSVIALVVDPGDDWKNVQVPTDLAADPPPTNALNGLPLQTSAPSGVLSQPLPGSATPGHLELVEWHLIGPSAKQLLQDYNIDAKDLPRTGPGGSLLKIDVLAYATSKGLKKVSQEPLICPVVVPAVDIPLTKMRNVIAKRLTESKTTIPHEYATIDCSMGAVMKLRKSIADEGFEVSVNDFIIKAAGVALKDSPEVNSIWQAGAPKVITTVDISFAVATKDGLLTPIVKNVPSLGLAEVASTVKILAEKARNGKLKPEEYIGGSFCISNLGMYGIREFSAIINPPQVAILAVGATRLCPGEDFSMDYRMLVTLSYDRRAINELQSAQFLERFQLAVEHPKLLVVGSFARMM